MIKFQLATKSDIPILQQLAHTIWHHHYPGIISKEQIEYMLSVMYSANQISKEIGSGHKWILILDEFQPIGFIALYFEVKECKLKLNKLYILPSFHGKGIGQLSLNYSIEEARLINAKQLYLTVNKQNTKAIKAYIKAGFKIDREAVADIGSGYVMDDYIMSKDMNLL
jgi:GNAT superfamily N-acetyltransferase